ncbi:MAG: hypothetical protein IT470_00605 [Pseudomonadales bacterium]|nr:hypothetical protein [Pseudomonadales bacterium]
MSNQIRLAKGLPPFKSITEIDDDLQKKREAKDPKDDFLLMESAKILTDFMSIQSSAAPSRALAEAQ